MARNRLQYLIIIALALAFGITACAGGNRANLKKLNYNKENELRQNWKDYTVYIRTRDWRSPRPGVTAFLYKLRDDKKIIMNSRWHKLTTEDEMAKYKIVHLTKSLEILGHNKELYGYLVQRADDLVNVRIIDEQTVKLFYHYYQGYTF
jgi:hypothetical protein